MPEIGGIGSNPVSPTTADKTAASSSTDAALLKNSSQPPPSADFPLPIGPPGQLGQPTGLPIPGEGRPVLPDVLTQPQTASAEQLRSSVRRSAVDQLLGLDRQPTVIGALPAPPGNAAALRHMTPTLRRIAMRSLLTKQREALLSLARLMRERRDLSGSREDEAEDRHGREDIPAEEWFFEEATMVEEIDKEQLARARKTLSSVSTMLDRLDQLLAMQDYALSQMGTFSKG